MISVSFWKRMQHLKPVIINYLSVFCHLIDENCVNPLFVFGLQINSGFAGELDGENNIFVLEYSEDWTF